MVNLTWTHKELLKDLKGFVSGTEDYVCHEVNAGSRWLNPGAPIPDLLRIRKSYTRPDFIIYEVKASRSDFMSDITSGKWQKYLPYCSRLYFATPAHGVAKPEDIPKGIGWIVRGDQGWHVRKAPHVKEFEIDVSYIMALLMAESRERQDACRQAAVCRYQASFHNARFGAKVRKILDNRERSLKRIAFMRRRYNEASKVIEEHLGIRIFKGWGDDLGRKIKSMKAGVDENDLRSLECYVDRIQDVLKDIKSKANNIPQ